MFNESFGKGRKPAQPAIEVVEDDPETTWGMWESALAELDTSNRGVPGSLNADNDYDSETQPVPLEDKTPEQRKNDALEVVEKHHQRVANTIRTLWGDKECSTYISKLILDADDGMGHARAGFNQDAVVAMMDLATLHDAQFGAP
jgi:hypothetical protein